MDLGESNKLPNLERPDDYVPDTVTELIYGTYITAEECDKLILEKNIYNLTDEELLRVVSDVDAYWQMQFMSYREGEFDGMILMPHPITDSGPDIRRGCTYIIGLLLGTFKDDMSYNVDDAYCGIRMEKLKELFPSKKFRYLLFRFDVSQCKSKDGN